MKKIILITTITSILLGEEDPDKIKQYILSKIENKKDSYKINRINTEINLFKYKKDKDLYNKPNYIASLDEFLENNGGDCEDYVVAKYTLLKDEIKNKMYIRIFKYKKEYHSTLLIRLNNYILELDNIYKYPHLYKKSNVKDLIISMEKYLKYTPKAIQT